MRGRGPPRTRPRARLPRRGLPVPRSDESSRAAQGSPAAAASSKEDEAPAVMDAKLEIPRLPPPGTVQISDNVIPVEISEYAGYAGLIAANGGLDPSENSVFFKNYGVKVKLSISEGENWSALNEGKIAASVTTADVLAVYGRQLHATTPGPTIHTCKSCTSRTPDTARMDPISAGMSVPGGVPSRRTVAASRHTP